MKEVLINKRGEAEGLREVGMDMFSSGLSNPYLTIRDFAKQYSTWTESSIRWLIYNNTEGFNDSVIRRIGKSKILISVSDFWNWIERQNRGKNGKKDVIAVSNSAQQHVTAK